MATFTIAKAGLMDEATLGGQKLKYESLKKRGVVIDEPPSGGFFLRFDPAGKGFGSVLDQ